MSIDIRETGLPYTKEGSRRRVKLEYAFPKSDFDSQGVKISMVDACSKVCHVQEEG